MADRATRRIFNCRLTESEHELIRVLADKDGITKTALIRDLLCRHASEREIEPNNATASISRGRH